MCITSLSLAAGLFSLLSSASPVIQNLGRRAELGSMPAIASNFADPSYIEVNGTYYGFATSGDNANTPISTSPDFKTWTLTGKDALPTPGAWANAAHPNVWAPDVVQLSKGGFVLYYSATDNGPTGRHCVGAATASTVEGPYTAEPSPIACPISQGGAIDISGYTDHDGSQWVVYKVDGNGIGNGGNCGNSIPPLAATPIMLQQVEADGVTPMGQPQQILDRGDADGPLVEAPSLSRIADPTSAGGWMYVLFFSSNCYSGPDYDTSYAISTNGIANGGKDYTKATKALLTTGFNNLYSPGGLTSAMDLGLQGDVVFHADLGKTANTRQMWTGSLTVDVPGRTVSI